MKCLIGLGSNLGEPIKNLEKAAQILAKVSPDNFKISPVYQTAAVLPDKFPPDWDLTYYNAVGEITWDHSPESLLSLLKKIESDFGRRPSPRWSPRIIDLDLLTFGREVFQSAVLQIPHPRMTERSFVLDPMKDLLPGLTLPGSNASILYLSRKLRTHRPLIMGIVNLTPDSFSDGGLIRTLDDFKELVKDMDAAGTQIIDIGAESTRPGARVLTAEEEWIRLEPALLFLKEYFSGRLVKPLISIDTCKPETAEKCLKLGADIINDVSGFKDQRMLSVISDSNCHYILMHSLSVPADSSITLPRGIDPVAELKQWLEDKLSILGQYGIDRDRVIFDVGIGFGKTADQSIEVLERAEEFNDLPVRVLIGHSRKSFMKSLIKPPQVDTQKQRDALTLSFSRSLAQKGVDILRVHHYRSHMEVFI